MAKRTITALLLAVIGLPALLVGGIPYYLLMGFFLVAAAWEYASMFTTIQTRPSRLLTAGGTFVIFTARFFFGNPNAQMVFGAVVLFALAYHVIEYERGYKYVSASMAATLSGLLYIGWIGSYLAELRALPNGGWWIMLVLPCVWLTDTGAYMIGVRYGKHKMTPRLSPKKSWEGYLGGIISAVAAGAYLAWAFTTYGPLLHLTPLEGAMLGLLIGTLSPLGDLAESMIKREAGLKDSGNILPGHGGSFDRIDSWLWAVIIGYYFVTWFGI